jgi:DNA mismatch endonuclease, patch repair protein
MPDVLTPAQRSLNMSRIRGRDTRPELRIRRGLHGRGFRFRLHRRDLPGRPDLIFPRHRAAVFVHGCFWHSHGCRLSKIPETRREFWLRKLEGNASRDRKAVAALQGRGWRVLVIWECALRGARRQDEMWVLDRAAEFLEGGTGGILEIAGKNGFFDSGKEAMDSGHKNHIYQ